MIKLIQKKFFVSREGAQKSLLYIFYYFLIQLISIFSFGSYYFVFETIFLGKDNNSVLIGLCTSLSIMLFIFNFLHYDIYTITYKESALLRLNFAENLRKIPLSYYNKVDISDLTTTLISNTSAIEEGFSHLFTQALGTVLATLILVIMLISYNWQTGLALLWIVPLVILIYITAIKKIKADFRKAEKEYRNHAALYQDMLDNVQEIKSYNIENKFLNKIEESAKNIERDEIRTELFGGIIINSLQAILSLGTIIGLIVSTILFASGQLGSTKEEAFLKFLMLTIISANIFIPITGLIVHLTMSIYVMTKLDKYSEIFNQKIQSGDKELNINNYDIEFKNVNFKYIKENESNVINDISLKIKQGEVTALIGPSGGGKTTIAKLASRFYDIDSGTITLGGENIADINPESLLTAYSIVFQDVILFDASIFDNIKIGKKDATDEEIYNAAKIANCDLFVNKLPDGYNTIIGENGCRLSGGERQRISIARAILKDAPIIILDEASASLDVENESMIQEALSKLIKNKTVIIIAHRMRTVMNADNIYVISNGRVIEEGTSEKLIKNKSSYFSKVFKLQNDSQTWKIIK